MKPINKVAAMGMSIGNHHTPYMRKIQAPHWENRPRLSPIPTTFYDYYNNFEDLTGQRFGRLDVVGYKRTHHSRNNPWHWICRCDCGMYVGKSTKALKKAGAEHTCEICSAQRRARDFEKFAKTNEGQQWINDNPEKMLEKFRFAMENR